MLHCGRAGVGQGSSDQVEDFERLRPRLLSIAYRIVGSADDAQDVVQDAWLRSAASTAVVVSPEAFLTTVVTRLSVDLLRSRGRERHRQDQGRGYWLSAPPPSEPDPERSVELAETVSTAALLLLERLTSLELAVLVLRDVFEFDFTGIAQALHRSPAACRQLAVRARHHLDDGSPRFAVDRREHRELAARFLDAVTQGEVGVLRDLLAERVLATAKPSGIGLGTGSQAAVA